MPPTTAHVNPTECAVLVAVTQSSGLPQVVQNVKVIAKVSSSHLNLSLIADDSVCPQANNREVGTLTGIMINRKQALNALGPRGLDAAMLRADSRTVPPERFDFASTIFDQLGLVLNELVDHEYAKGSGCWGRELNKGSLIYVDAVRVPVKVSRITPNFDTTSLSFRLYFAEPSFGHR